MNEVATFNAPSMDEMQVYMKQAEMLAASSLVPNNFRGKPADVLVAALAGRELGMPPVASMQYLIVINGKPTLNAEGRVALIRKHGHSITGSASPERAVATGKRADTGDEMTVEWTIQMANRAGLVKNGPWRQYPEAMLWARAVSQLSRMLFADVFLGVSYDPSELDDPEASKVVSIADHPRVEAIEAAVARHPASITGRAVDVETGEVVDVVEPRGVESTRDIGTVEPPDADEGLVKLRAAMHAKLTEVFALPPGKGRQEKINMARHNLISEVFNVESSNDLTAEQIRWLLDQCKARPHLVREKAGVPDPVDAA